MQYGQVVLIQSPRVKQDLGKSNNVESREVHKTKLCSSRKAIGNSCLRFSFSSNLRIRAFLVKVLQFSVLHLLLWHWVPRLLVVFLKVT